MFPQQTTPNNVVDGGAQQRLWIDAGLVLGARWQPHRHLFVEVAAGSFSNVVGLPMERLGRLLRDYPALLTTEARPGDTIR